MYFSFFRSFIPLVIWYLLIYCHHQQISVLLFVALSVLGSPLISLKVDERDLRLFFFLFVFYVSASMRHRMLHFFFSLYHFLFSSLMFVFIAKQIFCLAIDIFGHWSAVNIDIDYKFWEQVQCRLVFFLLWWVAMISSALITFLAASMIVFCLWLIAYLNVHPCPLSLGITSKHILVAIFLLTVTAAATH